MANRPEVKTSSGHGCRRRHGGTGSAIRGCSDPSALPPSVERKVLAEDELWRCGHTRSPSHIHGLRLVTSGSGVRSIEFMLDEICKATMPPVVHLFDVQHRATELGGVPGILYLPRTADPEGVILYLHGGGYIGTSPTMYAFFTAHLCRETRCAVFVADYRLAPEFPYPAGVEDAMAVLDAFRSKGVPETRLFLAGDSGGGGLANSLVVEVSQRHELFRPAGLILFSPEVDLRLDEPSVTDNAERDILPWNIPTSSYLHGLDASSAYVSSINADVTNFPPTFVSWGGDEMFRDPIRRFAARLKEAGIVTHAHEVPGMFHVFQILMPWAAASNGVFRHVANFVRYVVADAPPLKPQTVASLRT